MNKKDIEFAKIIELCSAYIIFGTLTISLFLIAPDLISKLYQYLLCRY